MAKVYVSDLATLDRIEIWCYIAQDSPASAGRFIEKIDEKCRMLARRPHPGL